MNDTSGRKDYLSVRGVDSRLWQAVRAEAIHQEMAVGQLLNTILEEWLASRVTPDDRRAIGAPSDTNGAPHGS